MPSLTPSIARRCYMAAALASIVLIAIALYFQYVMKLEPCPLCIFQRVAVMALGLWAGIAAVINPIAWGRRIVGAGFALFALLIRLFVKVFPILAVWEVAADEEVMEISPAAGQVAPVPAGGGRS